MRSRKTGATPAPTDAAEWSLQRRLLQTKEEELAQVRLELSKVVQERDCLYQMLAFIIGCGVLLYIIFPHPS